MITRRRFLAISAAAMATPAVAAPVTWQGYAMGATVSLTLDAPEAVARPAIARVRAILARCEQLFSLYDPHSALSRLNSEKQIPAPDGVFQDLVTLCGDMHRATAGRFDPTVQPLWSALAKGDETAEARRAIGWERVKITPARIAIGADQALTLNGIAQGFATDLVASALHEAGLSKVLVNIGEFHGAGRPWRLGVSDPVHGLVATRLLQDRAIATSSPGAMPLGQDGTHILDPLGQPGPVWSTVSVEADSAAVADALSTAFCHAPKDEISAMLRVAPGRASALCVAQDGTVHTIQS